ncbi:glycosyltransferase family 4 protein [Brachybacterium saurashtrense]|nr:glycosyltransferase family 4 protein [Brachybacterium saurashtrense]
MPRDRLVVVQLDAVQLDTSRVVLSTKSLHALELYAAHWPGETVVAVEVKPRDPSPLLTSVRIADLGFTIVDRARMGVAQLRRDAAVTLAMHDVYDTGRSDLAPDRLVLYGEIPLAERIRMAQIGSGRIGRLRAAAGWRRRRGALREMVARTGGFQANGYPALEDYGTLSPSAMVYFDTRASAQIVLDAAHEAPARPSGRPFTVGFSGRHTAAKGPEHVLAAVLALLEEGLDLRLVLYGSGELTPVLQERASAWPEHIDFRGDLDFATDWVHDVPRTVDLMVLPHVQGDPSGTYLESAAVGVPVLGFDNVALQSLVDRHGIGWTVPLGDTSALAARIRELSTDPAARSDASQRGRDLMREHHFEAEFARRVRHLRDVAAL